MRHQQLSLASLGHGGSETGLALADWQSSIGFVPKAAYIPSHPEAASSILYSLVQSCCSNL
jgi:hypothetical protein